jgi:hypothetical protein
MPLSILTEQAKTNNRGTVITSASTGIAGILLIGGGTVHSKFHVPNSVNSKSMPNVSWESIEACRLRNAELIIIDVFFFMYYLDSYFILGSQYVAPRCSLLSEPAAKRHCPTRWIGKETIWRQMCYSWWYVGILLI